MALGGAALDPQSLRYGDGIKPSQVPKALLRRGVLQRVTTDGAGARTAKRRYPAIIRLLLHARRVLDADAPHPDVRRLAARWSAANAARLIPHEVEVHGIFNTRLALAERLGHAAIIGGT